MRKIFSLIISLILLSSACMLSGCRDEVDSGSSSGGDTPPPVIVQPIYNIKVEVKLSEYGADDLPAADAIERSAATVYGLKATNSGMEVLCSAVAIMSGELDESKSEEDPAPLPQNEEVPENTRYFTYFATCLNSIEGADEYVLTSPEGEELVAEFVGGDPNTNVAILQVESKLPTAQIISDSDEIRLADDMFAVGFPFNAGSGVVKMTSLGAREHGVNVGLYVQSLMVLADQLNLGYTGGAAYALKGGLLAGIITSYDGIDTDGYSFAIPANVVVEIAKGLVTTYSQENFGYIDGNFVLGMAFEDATLTTTPYVYISDLDQSGSVFLGGMRVGDRITRIGYTKKGAAAESSFAEVQTKADLTAFLGSLTDLSVGDTLNFRYVRDRMSLTRSVEIKQYVYGSKEISD